ncbi:MAG: hypothetical protein U5K79_02715 [Cyclobacteriaceae bacterium]|nr:hypothetical protein [Cyclobacteriaceae bacterium]
MIELFYKLPMKVKGIFFPAIIVLIIFLVGALFIFLNTFLENRVKSTLQGYINTSPDRPYDYSYKDISIQLLRGNTYLTEVKISPRPTTMGNLVGQKARFTIDAQIDTLALRGLSVFQLLANGSIDIDKILVDNVHFRYFFNRDYTSPDSVEKRAFVLQDVFSENLKTVKIGEIQLRDISAYMNDINDKDTIFLSFDSANMVWKDLYTDDVIIRNLQPFTYSSLQMSAKNFIGNMIKSHTIRVRSFSLNTAMEEINFTGVHFGPVTFDLKDTSKQILRSINEIDLEELLVSGINFDSWQEDKRLEIHKITAKNPDVKVSMDHHWPKPMHERPYLSARVRRVPFRINIDTIYASGGKMYYRELFNDGNPPLELFFTDASMTYLNVCNDTIILADTPDMTIDVNAMFLGTGKLSTTIVYPVLDSLSTLYMKLKIDSMPLTVFNPILEGQVMANVSGDINTIAMNFTANKYESKGDFVFDYSHLKVELFKEKQTKDGLKIKKNWIMNTLVNPLIRSNNNLSQENFNKGVIDYQRPLDISFFGMVWQSLKGGMVTTLIPSRNPDNKNKNKDKKEKE